MIVSPQEYNNLLLNLRDPNSYSDFIRIPQDEPIYQIDLDNREVQAPKLLGVEDEHNAEIIWFITDRFYDNIDLYNSTCWILYINGNNEEYFCAAPIIAGANEYGKDKVLIPWAISKEVTRVNGTIKFSIQFFKLSEDKTRFLYVINTKESSSRVDTGLRADSTGPEHSYPQAEKLADDYARLWEAYSQLSRDYEIYWTKV